MKSHFTICNMHIEWFKLFEEKLLNNGTGNSKYGCTSKQVFFFFRSEKETIRALGLVHDFREEYIVGFKG